MNIEQIYTGCLAQGAYYIESNGEAAIVDPLREVQPYLDRAQRDGAKIKYIFETHFHADFVSGHLTLAEKSGGTIVYGPNAKPSYDVHIATDGEVFTVGELTITALHTPGHTLESTTYLLKDKEGKEIAIFSGDTLFLGDVGRPDLAQKGKEITERDLAGMLYDSLRSKIMPLPDNLLVYPAHGAGSACGKNMMKETVDTLGNQKKVNYALRADMTKEEFIQEVTDGLLPPPSYFPMNVKLNKEGYDSIDDVMERSKQALNPTEFELAANASGAVILDVRHQSEFAKGHIPRSIFIGIKGDFAPWVGDLIADIHTPILLVAPTDKLEETITRLSRVGFDNVIGYLQGGFESWAAAGKQTDVVESISATDFEKRYNEGEKQVVDVRKPGEYEAEHLEGVLHASLSEINNSLDQIPSEGSVFVHCAGGYRSMIAASILKSRGIHNIVDVQGGFGAIKKTNLSTTAFVCPSTL